MTDPYSIWLDEDDRLFIHELKSDPEFMAQLKAEFKQWWAAECERNQQWLASEECPLNAPDEIYTRHGGTKRPPSTLHPLVQLDKQLQKLGEEEG